ncbi:MAG: phosphorylase family protein, partial [Acidimicrobiales bacterium]
AVGLLGFAGGLSRSDRAGDLVVATEIVALDGSRPLVRLDLDLAEGLRVALVRAGCPRVRAGRLVCSTRLRPAREVALLEAARGALCCEMESVWLAPLLEGRSSVVLRVIVDRPGWPLVGPWTITGGAIALRKLVKAAPVVAEHLAQER